MPPQDLPEIAFVGRSNAGKSSLLNALTNHKTLARVATTPGRTQMANFFMINRKLYLVDLPGYGYAEAGRQVAESWQILVGTYLERSRITNVVAIFDIRRKLDDLDLGLAHLLNHKVNCVVVFSKIDKLGQSDLAKAKKDRISELAETPLRDSPVFYVSNLKKTGMDSLKRFLFGKDIT